MTQKTITFKFAVLTALAVALGIIISIGAAHWTAKYPAPIDRHTSADSGGIANLPSADGRFSRVHLLVSRL
jgi:hypothetical protein